MGGILITGSSGFLGRKLVKNLLVNSKYELYLTEHRRSLQFELDEKFSNRVKIIKLKSPETLQDTFENNEITQVVHAATLYGRKNESKSEILECNLLLPLKILEIGKANGLKHFVNIDTYFTKVKNEMAYLLDYTNSKRSLYNWLGLYSNSIRISNLIIEHMYGPGDSTDKFVPILINETKNGFKSNLKFSPGNQKRDFVYVGDVVESINFILTLDKSKLDRYLNLEIGTGTKNTLVELFDIIQEKLGTSFDSPFGSTAYREMKLWSL